MTCLVIGAGSWGTAVAIHLAHRHPVSLWSRNPEQTRLMQDTRENKKYLPGILFPDNVDILDNHQLMPAIIKHNYIILAVPSTAFRETLLTIKPSYSPDKIIIWLTKGLDPTQHELLHSLVQTILGQHTKGAILSGPSFAKEVALRLPTAVTLAGININKKIQADLIQLFHSRDFRVYLSSDITGVELGGAIKNIMAIAVGLAEGLQCGANAQAALITRGLAEMIRLGTALGGLPDTFMGLSGVGDLILTCTSMQSRNRRLGLLIGQGKSIEAALTDIQQVAEGFQTTREIYALSQHHHISMPIVEQVYQVLYEKLAPKTALDNLLSRSPKIES